MDIYKKTISNRSSFVRSQTGEGWRESNWPNKMVYLVLLLGKKLMSWLHSYLKNKKVSAISRPYDFASYKHFQPALSTRVITSIIGNRTLRPLDVWCSWWVSCLWSWLARSKLWPMPRNANRTSASALEANLRSSYIMQSVKICNTKCRVLKDLIHEINVPTGHHAQPWRNQLAHDFHLLDLRP